MKLNVWVDKIIEIYIRLLLETDNYSGEIVRKILLSIKYYMAKYQIYNGLSIISKLITHPKLHYFANNEEEHIHNPIHHHYNNNKYYKHP